MNILIKSKNILTFLLMQQIICGTKTESADDWTSKYEEVVKDTNRLAGQIARSMNKWHHESGQKLQTVVFLAPGKGPVICNHDLCMEHIKSKVVLYLLYAGKFGYMLFEENSAYVRAAFSGAAKFPEPLAIGILRKEEYVHEDFKGIILKTNLDQSMREYLVKVADSVYSASDLATKDFELCRSSLKEHPVLKKFMRISNNAWKTAVMISYEKENITFLSREMDEEKLIELAEPAIKKPILVLLFDANIKLVEASFNEQKCPPGLVNCITIGSKGYRKKFDDILAAMPQQDLAASIIAQNNELHRKRREQHDT